eukprot:COSAG04_NODE_19689_length_410_cov_0.916399_1_plen_118_part_01
MLAAPTAESIAEAQALGSSQPTGEHHGSGSRGSRMQQIGPCAADFSLRASQYLSVQNANKRSRDLAKPTVPNPILLLAAFALRSDSTGMFAVSWMRIHPTGCRAYRKSCPFAFVRPMF